VTIRQYSARHVRAWHRNSELLYRNDQQFDYTFGHVNAVAVLMELWHAEGLHPLDDHLVERLMRHENTETRGNLEGERIRAAKLILDAAREFYHLPLWMETGLLHAAKWAAEDDSNGTDYTLMTHDGVVFKIQMAIRVNQQIASSLDTAKDGRLDRRGGNNDDVIEWCVTNVDDLDTSCQPWVLTHDTAARLVRGLLRQETLL